MPQADLGGREEVGPAGHVALEQPRHREPDRRGAAQHDVATQIVGDPCGPVARPTRLRGVAPHAARKVCRARAKPSAR